MSRLSVLKEPHSSRRPIWIPSLLAELRKRYDESMSSVETLMQEIPDFINEFPFYLRKCKYQLSYILRVETDLDRGLIWLIYNEKDAPVITLQITEG